MKFHRIAIENINSLYGRQEIDFEEEFDGVPLYLIMGPTGSGKTTILDAVCLALFGETPRQDDNDGGVTGVGDRVNSYRTGHSQAEVEFSLLEQDDSREGAPRVRNRYRAIWRFRRAYEKPDGNPQPPERELKKKNGSDDWEVLTSTDTKREYEREFDAVLDGMELEDFLRSIMLAQGEFDELLTAGQEEKAAILERLTDTSEYKEIGRRASEQYTKERKALDKKKAELENFDGASTDDIEAARRRLNARRAEVEELEEWRATAEAYRGWLSESERIDRELEEAEEALQEAESDQKEHAEDFEKLAADEKTRPARRPLREVRRLESAIEKLEEETLPEREEAVEEAAEEVEEADTALEEAKEALSEAEETLDEQKPAIDEGKKLKTQLESKGQQREALDEKIESLEEEVAKRQKAVEAADEALAEAEETLEEKTTALEETPDASDLQDQLAGLEAERGQVADQAERVDGLGDEVDALVAKIEEQKETVADREEALGEKQSEVEPLEEAHAEAEEELGEQLGESEGPTARRDAIQQQKDAAGSAKSAAEELGEAIAERAELNEEATDKQEELEEAEEALEEADATVEGLEERAEELDERLRRLDMELQAVDLRRQLADGEACPVCGSCEHPDLHGAADDEAVAFDEEETQLDAERDRIRRERESLAEELTQAKETRQTTRDRVGKLKMGLEQLDEKLDAAGATAREAREALREDAGEWLTVELEEPVVAEEAEAAVADCEERLEALAEARTEVDEAAEALESAEAALEEANDEVEELEEARKEAADELERLEERKKEKRDDLRRERERLEEARRELKGKFDADGIPVPTETSDEGSEPVPDFEKALQAARERLEAWQTAKEEKETAEEAREEAKTAAKEAKTALENAEKNLEERQEELEELDATMTELEEQLEELFEGRDPETVEEELEAAVEAARKTKEAAGEAANEAKLALNEAETKRDNAREQLEGHREELDGARGSLHEALAKIDGMETVEDVESAMLDDQERESLTETCEAIEQAVHDAETKLEDLGEAREAHDEEKPDRLDPEDYDTETLAAAEEQLDAALGSTNQRIGGLEAEIAQMKKTIEKQRELERKRDAQKKKFELWKQMNALIGVRNGDKFKEFAQALNLDKIVERANRRLEGLHARYQLRTKRDPETNLPTLDFEIIDDHHAGQARPLSTLSGGETFLVSLALALALADKQKIKMPIETLFLDEGFGTLDRESLQNAVEILKNLQAGGERTVGVISHVEALREKIPDQIVLERQQKGRSTIKIPD